MKLGNTDILGVNLGAEEVTKVYRGAVEVWTGEVPPTPFNVALASNGATATASHTAGTFTADKTINGFRHTNNVWNGGGSSTGGWDSGTGGTPPIIEIDFGVARSITSIFVFTLADSLNYNTDPTISDTFTLYGQVGYELEYWNGSSWVNIVTVTGNSNLRKEHSFSAISTTKIRLKASLTADMANYGRIVEIEAWGT